MSGEPASPRASEIQVQAPTKQVVNPAPGEMITSSFTGNTYTIGSPIGEGHFGVVFACTDVWQNELAAKVLKPTGTYEHVKTRAEAEFTKLLQVRNPFITFVFDAFEYRDTFYIITERCYCPVSHLFSLDNFNGILWVKAISRCLLQAVHYLHLNGFVHQDIHLGNVFAALVKDEMAPDLGPGALSFKLADLGIAKLFGELQTANTRAAWMIPPEVHNPKEFGPIDHRIDLYHVGLLLLQIASGKELRFSEQEILDGFPRKKTLALPAPLNFALEKTLRRHVLFRTANAMELWRDLNAPPTLPDPPPSELTES
jgi:eukaryotic-like serine/threonine-protein kinase